MPYSFLYASQHLVQCQVMTGGRGAGVPLEELPEPRQRPWLRVASEGFSIVVRLFRGEGCALVTAVRRAHWAEGLGEEPTPSWAVQRKVRREMS